MATEGKRLNANNRVPVALPKGEPTSPHSGLVSQDISLQLTVGSQVRVSTGAPNQSTVEGTVYTADPITNLLVLNTVTPLDASAISSSILAAPSGSYRIIPISQISSFQILNLAQPATSETSTAPTTNAANTEALQARLARAVAQAQIAQSRVGPKGTSPSDQALFDALSRTFPTKWVESHMVISETFVIEKPYQQQHVKLIEGAKGDLERMRRVVGMESEKIKLKNSKGTLDRLEKEKVGVKKGG